MLEIRLFIVLLFLITQAIDMWQTVRLVAKHGLGVEKNKVVALMFRKGGSILFCTIKSWVAVVVLALLLIYNIHILWIILVDIYMGYIIYMNHRHSVGYDKLKKH